MSQKGKNYEDFSFIMEEIIRIQKKFQNEKKLENNMDAFCSLPHPSGAGQMLIGQAANIRFRTISNRALESNQKLKNRIRVEVLENAIKHVFQKDICTEHKELTQSCADKIVAKAIKHVQKNKLVTHTHHFPCILPLDKKKHSFWVGPVHFMQTEKFLADKEGQLESYEADVKERYISRDKEHLKRELTGDEIKNIDKLSKVFVSDLKEYYSNYPWIMALEIKDFESEKSKDIARLGAQTALNIIRLFFPNGHAEKIQIAGRPKWEWKTSDLIERPDGQVDISLQRRFKVSDETGWVKKYSEGEGGKWVAMLGGLIPFLVSGEPVPLLYQRLINALWWYGEALSVDVPYLKVTSLANALESFLATKKEDIASQISIRGGLLMSIEDEGKGEDWEGRIKKFYDMRSALVHGRISAFDQEVSSQIGWGVRITNRVLLEGISWTRYLADQKAFDDTNHIHGFFERELEKFCDADFSI